MEHTRSRVLKSVQSCYTIWCLQFVRYMKLQVRHSLRGGGRLRARHLQHLRAFRRRSPARPPRRAPPPHQGGLLRRGRRRRGVRRVVEPVGGEALIIFAHISQTQSDLAGERTRDQLLELGVVGWYHEAGRLARDAAVISSSSTTRRLTQTPSSTELQPSLVATIKLRNSP